MAGDDELQVLFRKVFGHPLQEISAPQVLERLKSGPQDLVCCLFWADDMPAHQLVLHRLTEDQRVVFYNPYRERNDLPVGSVLADPERRVEEDGLESVSFDVFRSFFTQRKAVCYSTEPTVGS